MTGSETARGAAQDERRARGVLSDEPVHLLRGVGWRAVWAVTQEALLRLWDDAMGQAGNIAFRALLAVFPFLIFATSLAALVADKAMADGLVTFMITLVPSAIAEPLILEAMDVLSAERGGVLSLGGLLTIWFAIGGVGGLRVGLNRAYDIREDRSAVVLLAIEVMSVILLGLGLVLLGYLLVLAPQAGSLLHRLVPGFAPESLELGVVRYLASVTILAAGLFAAHVVLSARRLSFSTMWPGILFTVVAWGALGAAFSLYLTRFANYTSYYAGLAGIVAGLYFLYLGALVLIFGGEPNRVIRIRRIAGALRRTQRRHHRRTPAMPNMTDPEHPRAPSSSRRIGRKEFAAYLHKLFGEPIPTNVRPDFAFSDDRGRYHLEMFLDTPDGMILAIHLDSGPAGEVDVLTFRKDA